MIMAGSKDGVAERKLRPLWDAIESRQYKSALKQVSALLAKHPTSTYLAALKGLVLERTGRPEEALALCQQAKEKGPVDDLTLNALQIVYQRLDRLDLITQCYEHATDKNPRNFDLLTCLFNCYVRQYTFIKQQQVAMKLYKLFGDEKYLLWAVCSIQLQVHCGEGNGVQLLPLAEAMMEKRIQSDGLTDLESLLVYVKVLREQQKFNAALEAISGKLGSLFTRSTDKLLLQGGLLMESRQYARAAEVYTELLKLNPDDWEAFLHLLDAVTEKSEASLTARSTNSHANGAAWSLSQEELELRLSKVDAFVEELVAKKADYVIRGPFLAKVEIARVRLLHTKLRGPSESEEISAMAQSLCDEIVKYFERFGHMVSFASDVKGFVIHVEESDREGLVEALRNRCTEMSEQDPVKLLRWRTSAYQIEEIILAKSWPDSKLVSQLVCILDLFVKNMHLSANLDPQESMHGEELLVLAVNLLTELYRRSQHIGYLVEAALVLEFGLSLRKHHSQYKLLLMNIYSLLSAGQRAFYWYKTVDIKYILLDTLSHHIVYYLFGTSLSSDLEPLLRDCIKFHQDHEVEASDLAIIAYQKGTYSKVLEFVQFKQKLQRSHHYALVRIEDTILSVKKESTPSGVDSCLARVNLGRDTYRIGDRKEVANVEFLEDLQMRPWWSPAPDVCLLTGPARSSDSGSWQPGCGDGERKMWEERARLGLRKRAVLPRLLYLSLRALSPKQENVDHDSNDDADELGRLVQELCGILKVPLENVDTWVGNMVERVCLVDESGVGVVDVLTLTVFACAHKLLCHSRQGEEASGSGLMESFEQLMRAISGVLELVLKSITTSFTTGGVETIHVVTPGRGISVVTRLTSEVFAWLGLCLQSWAKHMQPVAKKKKKAGSSGLGEEVADQNALCVVQVLQKTSASLSRELERLGSWLTKHLGRSEEGEVAYLLSLLKQGEVEGGEVEGGAAGGEIAAVPGRAIHKLQSAQVEVLSKWRPQSIVKHIVNEQRTALDSVRDVVMRQLRSLKQLRL